MNRAQAGVLVMLVLLGTAPLATVADDGGVASSGTVVEANTVEFRITVYENGSARWTFTYTRMLENETQRQRFQAFAEEFNENETDAFREFRQQAEALATNGQDATDRPMQAGAFSRAAWLGGDCVTAQDCGTIQMAFNWKAFAAEDGDWLVVGDVFGTGLYLSANQQLVFEAGPGLAFDSASPDAYTPSGTTLADSDSITYEGERSFSDQRPRVVLRPEDHGGSDPTATTSATDGADGTDPGSHDDDESELPMALIGGLIVVLLGAGAAIVWWRDEGLGSVSGADGGDGGSGSAQRGGGGVAGDPSVPEEELLTDEDRVLELLQENGGRMKQVDIVDETGWSKSKVSMLLSDMEDDDQISKLRVGRENIISLSGHEPEAAGSPHEED